MTFDPSGEGTSAIDVCFGISFLEMSQEVLTRMLTDLNKLVRVRLRMIGCYYHLPAPGNAAGDTVQVVCSPEVFVRYLPVEQRATWFEKWDQGDPIQRACRNDVTSLSHPTF